MKDTNDKKGPREIKLNRHHKHHRAIRTAEKTVTGGRSKSEGAPTTSARNGGNARVNNRPG